MRRFAERWWLVGTVLLVAVLVLTRALFISESAGRADQERATQRQAASVLDGAVHDVLGRELALARVIHTVGPPEAAHWPALANIVTSQPAATSAGFIVPVSEGARRAFERRTGLRLVESPKPGIVRPAAARSLHLVAVDGWSKTAKPVLGLDLAANPLRRKLLLRAAATGRQLATPPVQFLGPVSHRLGVIVYLPVYGPARRLEGWVTAAYQTDQLAGTLKAAMPGASVTVDDGGSALLAGHRAPSGSPALISVAGRRWSVWATRPVPLSPVPWLILGLGLALTAAFTLILRQAANREAYAMRRLSEHDAEEAALSRIATLVASGSAPEDVFAAVAREVGTMLRARTAAVSRFDPGKNEGLIVGGWTSTGESLTGARFTLDGVTASAAVYRSGRPEQTLGSYESETDPIAPLMSQLGSPAGIAAPIVVAGELWGALGSAFGHAHVPEGAGQRLERFARLVGLAIANADAWEKLDQLASTDTLTNIANRRTFDERLRGELALVRRYGRKLSLVVFDLDHFKRINDTRGHQVGDRVLAAFARLLAEHARQSDLVARIGGEEFAWVMPETDQEGAYVAAERVRAEMEMTARAELGVVTVSGGVATASRFEHPDSLIREADAALYDAKRAGRNTIACSGSPAGRSEAAVFGEHS